MFEEKSSKPTGAAELNPAPELSTVSNKGAASEEKVASQEATKCCSPAVPGEIRECALEPSRRALLFKTPARTRRLLTEFAIVSLGLGTIGGGAWTYFNHQRSAKNQADSSALVLDFVQALDRPDKNLPIKAIAARVPEISPRAVAFGRGKSLGLESLLLKPAPLEVLFENQEMIRRADSKFCFSKGFLSAADVLSYANHPFSYAYPVRLALDNDYTWGLPKGSASLALMEQAYDCRVTCLMHLNTDVKSRPWCIEARYYYALLTRDLKSQKVFVSLLSFLGDPAFFEHQGNGSLPKARGKDTAFKLYPEMLFEHLTRLYGDPSGQALLRFIKPKTPWEKPLPIETASRNMLSEYGPQIAGCLTAKVQEIFTYDKQGQSCDGFFLVEFSSGPDLRGFFVRKPGDSQTAEWLSKVTPPAVQILGVFWWEDKEEAYFVLQKKTGPQNIYLDRFEYDAATLKTCAALHLDLTGDSSAAKRLKLTLRERDIPRLLKRYESPITLYADAAKTPSAEIPTLFSGYEVSKFEEAINKAQPAELEKLSQEILETVGKRDELMQKRVRLIERIHALDKEASSDWSKEDLEAVYGEFMDLSRGNLIDPLWRRYLEVSDASSLPSRLLEWAASNGQSRIESLIDGFQAHMCSITHQQILLTLGKCGETWPDDLLRQIRKDLSDYVRQQGPRQKKQ